MIRINAYSDYVWGWRMAMANAAPHTRVEWPDG